MEQLLVVAGTFFFCVGSALIPVLHAEAYLVAATLLTPPELHWPLVVAAASGQMVGKVGMYLAGRGLLLVPGRRMADQIAAATAKYRERKALGGGLVFISAAAGLPPFYLVSIAAGMLHFPLPRFVVLGLIGRAIRFALAVFLPHLVMR
jgi:membrane protein YqaA with SNARE-associated domain